MRFVINTIKYHRIQLLTRQNKSSTALFHRTAPIRRPAGVATYAAQAGFNLNKALDKAHELKSLKEICDLPPSALQGLAVHSDDTFAALNIHSVKDLGAWKYYKAAKAIAALASVEEPGARHVTAQSNINKILKAQYEGKSIQEILTSPLYAFQGLTKEKALAALDPFHVHTVSDLANWKYTSWAEAITLLSKYENADFSSR